MPSTSLFSPEPARGWLPWGALAPVLLLFFVVLPVLATDAWFVQMKWADERGNPLGMDGLFAFLLIPFGLTGLMTLAWVRWIERRPLASIGMTAKGLRPWLGGFGLGALTISGVVLAIWIAGGYSESGYGLALASPAAMRDIGILALCFALQAGVEEIIFRGWLMSVLARKWNVLVAVIVVSLLFTLLHYGPGKAWDVMLSTVLFSVFTCVWALRAGNIWGVMGWHAGWNWLLSVGFELPVTGIETHLPALLVKLLPQGPVVLTGGEEGPEGSFLCSLFFLLGIVYLTWRQRREAKAGTAVSAPESA